MSVERRGQVIRALITLVNWQQEEPIDRGEGRQLFMDDTSRVSREAQARFSEGLGVKLPGATRPLRFQRIQYINSCAHSDSPLVSGLRDGLLNLRSSGAGGFAKNRAVFGDESRQGV